MGVCWVGYAFPHEKPTDYDAIRTEGAFLRAADAWAFAVHFVLSKTGLRVGELTAEGRNQPEGISHQEVRKLGALDGT
jgi:hypothetical protein